MSEVKHYEMANSEDPRSMIMASQRALVAMIKQVIADVRKDIDPRIPGLTWEQINHTLDYAAAKEPTIISQEHEL